MARLQEPPGEVGGGGEQRPLMSPGAAFIVLLLGLVVVLGGIWLYARSRQQVFETPPATAVSATTAAPATTAPALQSTAQPQLTAQPQAAPTRAPTPAAAGVPTPGPTTAPATQAAPAPQATVPSSDGATGATSSALGSTVAPTIQPTAPPAAASSAAEGARPAPTAQPTAPPPTAQPAEVPIQGDQSDTAAIDERIPLAVTGDTDPALVAELEHAYWLYWRRYAEADATLDADLLRGVGDETEVDATATLYEEWRAEGHAVHTDVRHHATLLSATPDRAVIFDAQESHSYYVSLATGEPEEPYPDPTTTNVLYQFTKIGDAWKVTGKELP
jgi:hypothetical protein